MISLEKDLMLQNALCGVAESYVGIHEMGGDNRGQMVERFQKAVDESADREPWCLGWTWYCILDTQNIVEKIIDGKYIMPHPQLYKSEHVLTMWNKSPKIQRVIEPAPGILSLWQHYNHAGKPTTSGHIEIITKVLGDGLLHTVGGNTSDSSPNVEREGDCVALKVRNLNYRYGSMRPLGLLSVW